MSPLVDAIYGLSLLLVLSFAPRGFSPGTLVFPSPQKPTSPNSNSIRNQVDEEPLCATSKSLFVLFMSPRAPQPKPNLLSLQKHIKRDWVRVYYASGIAWTLNQDIFYPVTSQDRAQFFTVNIQDGTERKLSLLHFLDFSFKSYNLCAIKPWLLYTSIVAMRLDILKLIFMSDGRSGSSKQVKLAKQCLVGQFCQWNSYWRRSAMKFLHEPENTLQLADELRVNADTCGRGNFWIRKENWRIQKYPDIKYLYHEPESRTVPKEHSFHWLILP